MYHLALKLQQAPFYKEAECLASKRHLPLPSSIKFFIPVTLCCDGIFIVLQFIFKALKVVFLLNTSKAKGAYPVANKRHVSSHPLPPLFYICTLSAYLSFCGKNDDK